MASKKKKGKKSGNIIITIILISMLGTLGYLSYKEFKPVLDSMKVKHEMRELAITEEKVDPWDRVVNFGKLKAVNSDIVGWVYIPEISVDYPIVIGDTDSEYLRKDIYGNYSTPGSIFAYADTSKDLSDGKIVLFGHNMLYYEMFGELKRYYREDDFRKEHLTFYVYTPEKTMELGVFSIFGCHETDGALNNFKDKYSEDFVNTVMDLDSRNDYWTEFGIRYYSGWENQQVFSLVTCKGQVGTDQRLVVNGVVKREKVVE